MKRIIYFFIFFLVIHAEGSTILVTAATGGLGEAISMHLASEGCDLILAGRNPVKLDALKSKIRNEYAGVELESVLIDFSDTKTIPESAIKFEKDSIDGIVLIGPRPSLSKKNIPSKEEWSACFNETFIAPLEVVRSFEEKIKDGGSIVVMSGSTSKSYMPNYPNTNVIRLAWTGEVKNLACFFGKRKYELMPFLLGRF